MASGSFVTNIVPGWVWMQVWWSSSPDTANNRSLVNVRAQMYRGYRISSTAKKKITITINGVDYSNEIRGWGGIGWTDDVINKSAWVPHDSSGSKTVSIRLNAYLGLTLSRKWYERCDSGTLYCKLDNLARKSTFSLSGTSSGLTLGDTFKFTLNRSSTSVRHDVTLKIGNGTWSLLSRSGDNGKTKAYTFTVPADALSYMSGQSATATVSCTTYYGSTSLGTNTATFTAKIRSSDKPSIIASNVSLTLVPVSPNTITTDYIVNKSQVKVVVSPTTTSGSAGAIGTYTIKLLNGKSVIKTVNATSNTTYLDLPRAGENTIQVTVKDKRGMSSNMVSKTITVEDYSVPTVTLKADRCLEDGTLSETGEFAKISIAGSYSDCNGANSATIKLYYEETTVQERTLLDTYDTIDISQVYPNFSIDSSFDFFAEIIDIFGASSLAVADMGTEELLVDMSEDAVAVGKVAERSQAFEVAWTAYFEEPIHATIATTTSDAREKKILGNIDERLLSLVNELQYTMFIYRNKQDKKIQTGVIAQEVIKLFEKYDLDWKIYGVVYGDEESGYSVNYDFIFALVARVVQLQSTLITDLTKRLDAVEKSL